jgi:hypothetical protein
MDRAIGPCVDGTLTQKSLTVVLREATRFRRCPPPHTMPLRPEERQATTPPHIPPHLSRLRGRSDSRIRSVLLFGQIAVSPARRGEQGRCEKRPCLPASVSRCRPGDRLTLALPLRFRLGIGRGRHGLRRHRNGFHGGRRLVSRSRLGMRPLAGMMRSLQPMARRTVAVRAEGG